jgi:hypothetical protein
MELRIRVIDTVTALERWFQWGGLPVSMIDSSNFSKVLGFSTVLFHVFDTGVAENLRRDGTFLPSYAISSMPAQCTVPLFLTISSIGLSNVDAC